MKLLAIALGFVAVLLVAVAAGLMPAQAQSVPGNVRAVDGASAGEATVSWQAVAVEDAAYYRIGWVSMDRFEAVRASGQNWLNAFAFTDVDNSGQAAHTLTDLAPGDRYAFIVGVTGNRFGVASWSEWAYLTLAEAPTSCPTDDGEPTPPQTATPTPAPTAAATPAPSAMPARTPTPTFAPTLSPTPAATHTPTGREDYDADNDGLIEISNLAQLNAIRADLNGDGVSAAPGYAIAFPKALPSMGCPNGCTGYELVADLDFDTNSNGKIDAGDAYWNDSAGWTPIGDYGHRFTAEFDGNKYTIYNLYINRKAGYVGLFGFASSAVIKHISLVSADVSGSGNVGGLVGYSHGSTTINGSYATGSIYGYGEHIGGLVGFSDDSTINDSHATSNVSGINNHIGGLVGSSRDSIISGSYATGNVSGSYRVGGLVGFSNRSIISGSYATSNVSSSGDAVGGLVGYSYVGSTISDSYATGSVSGVGDDFGGGDDIGGLVGRNWHSSITASYAIGRVSSTGDTFYFGGLAGYDEGGIVTVSYWDTQTTGQAGSYGGVGKTTAELQSPIGATGIYADWNPDHWDFGNSRQYPVLKYGSLDAAAQRQ